jgi:hypothetical protein
LFLKVRTTKGGGKVACALPTCGFESGGEIQVFLPWQLFFQLFIQTSPDLRLVSLVNLANFRRETAEKRNTKGQRERSDSRWFFAQAHFLFCLICLSLSLCLSTKKGKQK